VLPHLRGQPGHRGAYLLERAVGGEVEFTAMTLWDSMEVIRSFTGRDPTVAVVEPAARTMLASFDEFATRYEAAAFPMGWASTP
jgi:heme-degrading monooxygenase HmoA